EYILQDVIKEQLVKYEVPFIKEYKIAPRKRVDFFIDNRIVIEVKKGNKRPNRTKIIEQLQRYSLCDEVKIIIYVGEKNVLLPEEINGKRCIGIGLNTNWGLSL